MKTSWITGVLIAMTMVAVFGVQSAKADVLTYAGPGPYGLLPASFSNTTPPIAGQLLAGMFRVTNETTQNTFSAWCIDAFHLLEGGGNYIFLSGAVVSQAPNGQAVVNALGKFATNHLSSVVDTTSSAAFQIALWEIVHQGQQPLDVMQGSFVVDAGVDANALANSWLTPAANPLPNAMRVDFWVSTDNPRHQTIVVFGVPEPQSYAMMLAGLMLVILCVRRRPLVMRVTV